MKPSERILAYGKYTDDHYWYNNLAVDVEQLEEDNERLNTFADEVLNGDPTWQTLYDTLKEGGSDV